MVYGGIEDEVGVISCVSVNTVHVEDSRRNLRELAGEFSSDDASEENVLEVEGRRVWNGPSGMDRGVRRSVSEEASDMATSMSASACGKGMRLGLFAICAR